VKRCGWAISLGLALVSARAAPEEAKPPDWVPAMKQVHARFKGERGTFAQFGDSITDSMAFWAPFSWQTPKNMGKEAEADFKLVKQYQQKKCYREWKGPEWGNRGSMTIRWAHENVDAWLKKMNPEVAIMMFGTNDLGSLGLEEYIQKTREVVQKCLDNGTIVILSTIPPRHGRLDKAKTFAEAVLRIGGDLKVPVCDFMAEVLKRRPDDWDGTLEPFKDRKGYDVLTLIAGDGVHPSNPKEFQGDFSEEALKTNGFSLRNYLVLRDYAAVIQAVLR
jgi:lysophospholipase L1-like esterase